MITDIHTHIEPGKKSTEEFIAALKKAKVDKAIVLPIAPEVSNELINKECEKYPDKLIGFASTNPVGGKPAADKLISDMKKLGLNGIKLHPKLQKFSLSDKKVVEFFKELDSKLQFQVPVLIDCWFSDSDSDQSVEQTINFFVSNDFKNLIFILAHSGGFKYNKIMPLANKENLFIELSYVLNTFKKHNKEALIHDFMQKLKEVDPSKIVFGSDFPECNISETVKLVEGLLDNYGFTPENKSKIFSGNITRLVSVKRK